jgi:hypothetical protein
MVQIRTWMKAVTVAVLLLASSSFAQARDPYGSLCQKLTPDGVLPKYNAQVMKAVHSMPEGLGYKATDDRIDAITSAINTSTGQIQVDATKAGASFCSGGTYMVFLKVVGAEQSARRLKLSSRAMDEIKVKSKAEEPDGTGVWGSWNADGPGTSALFKELNLGTNFSDASQAKPGVKSLCFWSSNTTNDLAAPGDAKKIGGWGLKCVPQTSVYRAVFSRLENLDNLNNAPELMGKNCANYSEKTLASLEGLRLTSP